MPERQPDLFGISTPGAYGAPAQRHSATSQEAAEAIKPHLNELQARVLAYFRERGRDGSTDEEGIEATGLSPSTFRPRRIELVAAKLVMDSGRTRPTHSGRQAVVWIVAL